MKQKYSLLSYNQITYKLVVGIAYLLCVLLLSLIFWQKPVSPTLSEITFYQCDVENSLVSHKTLNVLLPIADHANNFAEMLCDNKLVSKYYSKVKVTWGGRSELTADELLKEQYQLLWARAESLQGMVLHLDDIYQEVLPSQAVNMFWLSNVDTAQLTPAFLANRVIGLVKDQKSFSSYLVPIASLKQQGFNLSNLSINYYDTYKSLYDAFKRKEVDLIPSGNWFSSFVDLDSYHKIAIGHQLETGELYMAKSIYSLELSCELVLVFSQYNPLFSESEIEFKTSQHCEY
ncbi:hypothetical protein [Colwellia sp. E2M01]|uniref:hypothetical protein n=1 Tax=Colwellia sp. E2M01 TaxID=2841561 RepID=UPI001C08CAA4|nr:hypothetical protein [Colwellia sp. E2M01]MBU2870957.1 hypothetical protein [Colwellia sp. E2M01]